MPNPVSNPAGNPLNITRVGKPVGNINDLKKQMATPGSTASETKAKYVKEKEKYDKLTARLKAQGKITGENKYNPVDAAESAAYAELQRAELNLKNAEKAYIQEQKYYDKQLSTLQKAGLVKDNQVSVKTLEQQRKFDLLKAQERRLNTAVEKYNKNLSDYNYLISKNKTAGFIQDDKFDFVDSGDKKNISALNQSVSNINKLADSYNMKAFGENITKPIDKTKTLKASSLNLDSSFPKSKYFAPVSVGNTEINPMAPRDAQLDYISGMYSGVKEDPLLGGLNLAIGAAFPVAGKGINVIAKTVPVISKNKNILGSLGSTVGCGLGIAYGGTVAYRTFTAESPSNELGKITSQEIIPGAIGFGIGYKALSSAKPLSKKVSSIKNSGGFLLNTRVAFNRDLLADPAIRKTMGIASPSGGIPYTNIGVTPGKELPTLFEIKEPALDINPSISTPDIDIELVSLSSLPRSKLISKKNPETEGVFITNNPYMSEENIQLVNTEDFQALTSGFKPPKKSKVTSQNKDPKEKSPRREIEIQNEINIDTLYDVSDLSSIPFTKAPSQNYNAVMQEISPVISGFDISLSPTKTELVKHTPPNDKFPSILSDVELNTKYAEETAYPKIFELKPNNYAQNKLFGDVANPLNALQKDSIFSTIPKLTDEGMVDASMYTTPFILAGRAAKKIKPKSGTRRGKIKTKSIESKKMPLANTDHSMFSSGYKIPSTKNMRRSYNTDNQNNIFEVNPDKFTQRGLLSEFQMSEHNQIFKTNDIVHPIIPASNIQMDPMQSVFQISAASPIIRGSLNSSPKSKKAKTALPKTPKKQKGKRVSKTNNKKSRKKKKKSKTTGDEWDINYNFDPFNLIGL